MALCENSRVHIIGLGVAEKASLSHEATQAILNADVIVGSERQLHTIDYLMGECVATSIIHLPKLAKLSVLLEKHTHQSIVILASGDPLYYGIGRWFAQHIAHDQLRFYPAVSSIQAACHQLGLSLQDVEVLSLHGRPLEKIRTQLHRHKRLVILTDQYSQPQMLAKECAAAGFGQSQLTVCENLGYEKQTVRRFSVEALMADNNLSFDPLHVTVIEVMGEGGVLPEFPGIPDAHYITGAEPGKGMISKREVRLVILSLMQASNNDIIWDVGAGCGGVAVELAYWNARASIYAIEHHDTRLEYLHANRERFGVKQNLHIIAGRAPEVLESLPKPTKVFIGGSDGELNTLLHYAWQQLPIGGVLVVSAVMPSTQQQLVAFAEGLANMAKQSEGQYADIESVKVAIERGSIDSSIRPYSLSYQPKLPVEIFKLTKCTHTAT